MPKLFITKRNIDANGHLFHEKGCQKALRRLIGQLYLKWCGYLTPSARHIYIYPAYGTANDCASGHAQIGMRIAEGASNHPVGHGAPAICGKASPKVDAGRRNLRCPNSEQ